MKLARATCADLDTLAGKFRGVLDFYWWKGIPCVRAWPYGAERIYSLNRAASAIAFGEIAKQKTTLNPLIVSNLQKLASGTSYTWADIWTANQIALYQATGDVVPAPNLLEVEYGSGLKRVRIGYDKPVVPVIVSAVWQRPVKTYKIYRGTTTICCKPNVKPGTGVQSFSLEYNGLFPLVSSPAGFNQSSDLGDADRPLCSWAYNNAKATYGKWGEWEEEWCPMEVWQEVYPSGWKWGAYFWYRRNSWSWTPVDEWGLTVPEYNGLYWQDTVRPEGPHGPYVFNFSVFGRYWQEEIVENIDRETIIPVRYERGVPLHLSTYPEDYYDPRAIDLCGSPDEFKKAYCLWSLDNLCVTFGPRWRWSWSRSVPLPRNQFLGIRCPDGNIKIQFPLDLDPAGFY